MKQRNSVMYSKDISYNGHNSDEESIPLKYGPEKYIEAEIVDGETLQAIALKFRCKVSDIKRINNIHKDNEIFARKVIKVPINPYSILTEQLEPSLVHTANISPSTSRTVEGKANISKINNILLNPLQGCDSDYHVAASSDNVNDVILNSSITPIVVPYTDIPEDNNCAESTSLIPPRTTAPLETLIVKQLTSQGADFGLKWYHMLFCVFVVSVIFPIIYFVFYKDYHEHIDVYVDDSAVKKH